MGSKQETAAKVVDKIVELIEKEGSLPWIKPWHRTPTTVTVVDGIKTVTLSPVAWNREGKPYRGANTYLPVGEYVTFNQCQKEGGNVLKGKKGWPIVFWKPRIIEETNPETGKVEKKSVPILRYHVVFRIEDTTLEQKHHPEPTVVSFPITHTIIDDEENNDLDPTAEAVITDYAKRAGNGFKINRDEVTNRAYYSPAGDYVSVPSRGQYALRAEYYSTLFHELGHSTGHKSRLNRFTGKAACATFGSEEYSREELIAEATAATMLNALGMEDGNAFRNSAAYIKSWASHIKNDPLMYVSAATKAQAAVDLILGVEKKGGHDDEI